LITSTQSLDPELSFATKANSGDQRTIAKKLLDSHRNEGALPQFNLTTLAKELSSTTAPAALVED
jgi:hypothetical protein